MTRKIDGVFIVSGPARVRVSGGLVEVLGHAIYSGEFVVPLGRSIPVKAVEAEVEVTPSPDRLSPGDPGVYEALSRVAREVSSLEPPVLLVGPSDSGKSTLAAMAAVIASSGGRASLLTVDVGQNEVYAPGFAALAEVRPPFIPGWVRGSEPSRCFVGSFTPSRRLSNYLGCAAKLASRAKGFLVVDTDGWVTPWDGVYSKAALATAVGASSIVHLGLGESESRALEALLPEARHVRVRQRLAPARKTRGDRRAHRERLVTARLVNAKSRGIRVDSTPVIGLPIGVGRLADREALDILSGLGVDARHVERVEVASDGQVILFTRKPIRGGQGFRVVRPGFERGLLASIHGPDGSEHIAVVERVNYRSGVVNVLTEYDGPARLLEVGEARVEEALWPRG